MCGHFDPCLQFTTSQDLHQIFLLDESVLLQEGGCDFLQGLAIDELLECVQVDSLVFDPVWIRKTKLGNTALEGHLSALKSNLGLVS